MPSMFFSVSRINFVMLLVKIGNVLDEKVSRSKWFHIISGQKEVEDFVKENQAIERYLSDMLSQPNTI